MTFKNDTESFKAGQTVEIGRTMFAALGGAYYKVFGKKVWVHSNEVIVHGIQAIQRRTYRSVL